MKIKNKLGGGKTTKRKLNTRKKIKKAYKTKKVLGKALHSLKKICSDKKGENYYYKPYEGLIYESLLYEGVSDKQMNNK